MKYYCENCNSVLNTDYLMTNEHCPCCVKAKWQPLPDYETIAQHEWTNVDVIIASPFVPPPDGWEPEKTQ
jgi:hypothetical protein